MLQEILLSLSGLPSPIWAEVAKTEKIEDGGLHDFISPPERAMLATLSHLSALHIDLKECVAKISSTHCSTICRAVSATIASRHLASFRARVIEVESSILSKDSGYVGGYDIVPLSTVVADFAPWTRRLEWLQAAVQTMADGRQALQHGNKHCTGAEIMDYLERETHTGYSDIEGMATDLLVIAQKAWMRSLSSWILYGKLPMAGKEDFYIQGDDVQGAHDRTARVSKGMQPEFLSHSAAEAALSVGNALNQIKFQTNRSRSVVVSASDPTMSLLPSHLEQLRRLQYPLNSALVEQTLLSINESLSRDALSHLLSAREVAQFMTLAQEYLFLGRGEFALSLISHADEHIAARQQARTTTKPVRKIGRLDDMTIKDAEFDIILNQTWTELASLRTSEDMEDDTFDLARSIVRLSSRQHDSIISTLLPTAAALTISLPLGSSLHLFLLPEDVTTYSSISTYLLSLRRTEVHLSSLWYLTAHRRCHPAPAGPPLSGTAHGKRALSTRRARESQRERHMRRHWATASKALYVMNELDAYVHGEVIRNSYEHFAKWLREANSEGSTSSAGKTSRQSSAGFGTNSGTSRTAHGSLAQSTQMRASRDPRTLAHAHHVFLEALHSGLLVGNGPYAAALKDVLPVVDHYVALFARLQTVWQGLDLQEDEGVLDAFSNYAQDETDILAEMDRTRSSLEDGLKVLVRRIGEMENDRLVGDVAKMGMGNTEMSFVPWRARTVDRLVMKLDSLTEKDARDGGGAARLVDEYES